MENKDKEIKYPKLANARKMAALHPYTFNVPSDKEIKELRVGFFAKVCAGEERFWVAITNVNAALFEGGAPNSFEGTVANDLVLRSHGLKFGDLIFFESKHIYSIL